MINDTLIAVPTGSKPIHLIKTGEEVLAGSAHLTNGKLELTWEASEVTFSSGTDAASSQPLMVYVEMEGTQEVLVCDPQKPVLLADGNYTTANKLRPGLCLVDKAGKSVPLGSIRIGQYHGGVHDIATGVPWNDSPNGHLLLASGVVVGDFMMQLHFNQLPDSTKEGDFSARPGLGTPEDSAAYPPTK